MRRGGVALLRMTKCPHNNKKENKMLKTGDIILTRLYEEDDIEMVESVTIIFEDGIPIKEEVERFTLREFNETLLEKVNETSDSK